MAPRLTAALIGCGRMGSFPSPVMLHHAPAWWFPLSHADAMRAHPRVVLRAVCDIDHGAAVRAAQAHGVSITYDDPRRMLDEVHPALVGIATRTVGRAELIGAALERGVRALHLEKPLCNGVQEWRSLARAMTRDSVFATYGALRRHLAPYRMAHAIAQSGRLGALREIRVAMGSATLYWTHPHSIDLLLFGAAGRRVSGVQARLAGVETGSSSLDIRSDPRVVSATIHFDDGVTGHVTQALGTDYVLSCADGEIIVRADGHRLETYATSTGEIYPQATPLEITTQPGPSGTLEPISQLVDCLDGQRAAIDANSVVKRDLLLGQQILFAMLQSHLEGSRIVQADAADEGLFVHALSGGRPA
jgi:scyllo-inositol 2-dehydrogenase (NAD+)